MATFNLPSLQSADGEGLKDQVRQIRSYIVNLNNQLRYSLSALDEDNFTDGELPEGLISAGFRQKVQDLQGNFSVFEQTAVSILARLQSAEGDIANVELTAQGLTTRISDAEGDITALDLTAQGLTARISDAEGDLATLDLTAQGLSTRMSTAEGDITALDLTAQGLSTAVTNLGTALGGKISTTRATTAPANPVTGDLWIDSGHGNLLYRWSGSAWVNVQDGAISTAQQKANKFDWLVASGDSASNMVMTDELYALTTAKAMIAASQEISLAVSDIQVGGTNLLLNSDFSQGETVAWGAGGGLSSNQMFHGKKSLQLPSTTTVVNKNQVVSGMVAPGETVTLSINVLTPFSSQYNANNGKTIALLRFRDAGNSGLVERTITLPGTFTNQWQRLSVTYTAPAGTASVLVRLISNDNAGVSSYLHFAEIKLEKGNKATGWSPAPNEVKTATVTINDAGIAMATGGAFTVQSGNFGIDASGNVTAKGTIEATAGKIGGFSLNSGNLIDTASSGAKMRIEPTTGILRISDLEITQASDEILFQSKYTGGVRYLRFANPNGSAMFVCGNPTNLSWMTRFDIERPTSGRPEGRTYNYGDSYIQNNCSALSFTDRTPAYSGNALDELRWVQGKKGHLDHDSIPPFARKKIAARREKPDGSYEEVVEEGRDLGAMVSVLTKAVQQLMDKVDTQQGQINQLMGVKK